jgi:predicted ATP-dependent serine protease
MNYAQRYYARKRAAELGISFEDYINQKTQPTGTITATPSEPVGPISFDKVNKLNALMIGEEMLTANKTGLVVDTLFSYEGGIPVGTNIMCTGDPGVGKTTVLLHTLANMQLKNPDLKCLFICAEMSKIQMFKYTQRFPIFGNVETLFPTDFMDHNLKDVMEQILQKGYDYVLIDSIVEVLDTVKEDCVLTQGQAEKWLVDLCVKQNEANNDRKVHTSMLLIQQVTKMGVFVGSNKLKHITDAHLEMKREGQREGGGTYMIFTKNRNGQSGMRFSYQLNNNEIHYGTLVEEKEEEPTTYQIVGIPEEEFDYELPE